MIKASYILKVISETYVGRYHSADNEVSFEVFRDPNHLEMRKNLGNEVRFTAVQKGEHIYVWNAYAGYHHEFDPEGDFGTQFDNECLRGTAERRGSKYIMDGSDQIWDREVAEKILTQDWSWVNRYIDTRSYLEFLIDDWEINKSD
jgi:hypothetical protein